MKYRKLLRILAVLLCLAVLAAGGLLAAKKAYSMYKNVFDESKALRASIADLGLRMTKLEETVGTHAGHHHFDYSWMDGAAPLVVHAGGEIDGHTYTNSQDAMELRYEMGYRIFEIDFDLTQEGALVAAHSENRWHELTGTDESTPFTLENFDALPLCGQYQSMNAGDVIAFLRDHPDAILITDTKYTDRVSVMLQFAQLVRAAQAEDAAILDRIVPQIYSEEMLSWVMDVHPFRSVVFTLYKTEWTPETVLRFCKTTGVGFITMFYNLLTPEIADLFAQLDLHVAVHTVNNVPVAMESMDLGADLIYTDKLIPADVIR